MVEHVHGGLLRWIELHPGTASWVQAVGAIAAIAAAFWIAQGQQRQAARDAKQERDVRAKALSYRVLPAVLDIQREVRRIRRFAQNSNYGLLNLQPGPNAVSLEAHAVLEMSIASTLNDVSLMSNIHILYGDAPKTIAQLNWIVSMYNGAVARHLGYAARDGAGNLTGLKAQADDLLEKIDFLAKEAIEFMRDIYDEDQLRNVRSQEQPTVM